MAELLGRGAAVFTTCYETSLLCSRDSVTQSEMKVMLLHIAASSLSLFPFHFLSFFLSFLRFFKIGAFSVLRRSSGVCEKAMGENARMTGDSTLADLWLSCYFCFFFFFNRVISRFQHFFTSAWTFF